MRTINENLRKAKRRDDAKNPNLKDMQKYSRNSSVLPMTAMLKNVPEWKLKKAQEKITRPFDYMSGQIDITKSYKHTYELYGITQPTTSILDFSPIHVWDSEHISVVGETTTLTDFNTVGVSYNLANTSSSNQPTFNASSVFFNNKPSLTFDGLQDVVLNNVSGFRSSDQSGMVISVYRVLSGVNLHLFTSADSANNDYLINQIIIPANGRFRLGTENAGTFNTHAGTDDINDLEARVYGFGSNGTVHKFFNNENEDIITASTAAGEWFADVTNRDNIAIGAQLRSSPAYSNIEWCMTGYFPYIDDATTISTINFLKTYYGIS